jgi:hypothetical protein
VKEETGISSLILGSPLMITYHTYHEGSKFILKDSHWYTMSSKGKDKLTPQQEEGISEVLWVSPAKISRYLSNSYPSVADVLRTVILS